VRIVAIVALVAALVGQTAQQLTPEQQALLDEFSVPFPPFHFVGNVYYVGTKELSSFLIVTPAGSILLDSGMEQSVPLIRGSVEKLGFKFGDIRILINSHAHFDHAGGNRDVRDATAAQVMVMAEDAPEVRRGHPDFALGWKPCPVDRVLKDGDTVSLAGVTLTAHLTPGHTKGCTTWTMRASENGRSYDVVFLGGFTINEGVKLLGTRDYPNMAADFARTFRVLESLSCDVFGAQHPYFFDMEGKVPRLSGDANPFVDPDGYRRVIADAKAAYLKQLAGERTKR
jgi:metallo-beta-lactamase class B